MVLEELASISILFGLREKDMNENDIPRGLQYPLRVPPHTRMERVGYQHLAVGTFLKNLGISYSGEQSASTVRSLP